MGGADDFLRLSKALKEAGHTGKGGLRNELNAEMRKAVKPVIPLTRAEALRILPHRGGYAILVSKTPQRVQVRTGDRTAGVRVVVATSKSSARRANRGVIRHPTFGNREAFVDQKVTPGWFDVPAQDALPEVRAAALNALDLFAKHVVSEVKRGR